MTTQPSAPFRYEVARASVEETLNRVGRASAVDSVPRLELVPDEAFETLVYDDSSGRLRMSAAAIADLRNDQLAALLLEIAKHVHEAKTRYAASMDELDGRLRRATRLRVSGPVRAGEPPQR